MKILKSLQTAFILSAMLAVGFSAEAQSNTAKVTKLEFGDGSVFRGMSANGLWATAYGVNAGTSVYSYPKLINVQTGEVTELFTSDESEIGDEGVANDVSNDGSIVVGNYGGKPAYYKVADKTWTTLPMLLSCTGGTVRGITGDGKYAVGTMGATLYQEIPAMWDLETGTRITLTNMPKVDLSGTYQDMCRPESISDDGRYIVGCVSYSYPQDIMYFLYDRENATWDPLAFTYDADSNTFTKKDDNIYSLYGISISPSGEWVAGCVWSVSDTQYPFRYNTQTKVFETFSDAESSDKGLVTVDNEGTLYASSPAVNPYRSVYILKDGYWYAIDDMLSQMYGINFYTYTGYDNTGSVVGVSGDGKFLCCNVSNTMENVTYAVPESFGSICSKVNLLNQKTIAPKSGSSVTNVSAITITFNKSVTVLADKSAITINDESGNVVKTAIKFATSVSNSKVVELNFRSFQLDKGKKYTITIPAGSLHVAGDATKTNDEFTIEYYGYGNGNLQVTGISPEDGSTIGHISLTTNPIVISFDTSVKKIDTAVAKLYKNDETTPLCDLNILVGNTESTLNQILLYPTVTESLYLGNTYKVVVPAGQVTDLSGMSSNSEITFTYTGSYERTVISDDTHIYIETFAGGMGNVILYDGDKNTPVEDMVAWGFASDKTAWNYAADDDYTNTCAVSHSMYDPAGKSDDWMVTPQLYIPDDRCRLEFEAQSYSSTKTDVLKVYVYASDVVYNDLDDSDITLFKANAKLIIEETLSPGSSDGSLSGDWTEYSYNLAEYAGKNIYIAFVNQNEDQSAIFVANLSVVHDSDFQIALIGVPESTLCQTEQVIKGAIVVTNPLVNYDIVKVQLLDAEGNVLEEINDNATINESNPYNFTFTKPLPLAIGTENYFSVYAELDETVFTTFTTKIDNLSFVPEKRVILEEETGQACQNCPLGHLMIEKLSEAYGNRFIPVCYHTYYGDSFENGMTDYAQYYLGLNAAPTATIQRSARAYSPMLSVTEDGTTRYIYTSSENPLWFDVVAEEFASQTYAQVDIAVSLEEGTNNLNVDYNVKFALDKEGTNLGLFFIVTEDKLSGYQQNGFYSINDENLGEWQAGGLYGRKIVMPYEFNDVATALIGNYATGILGYIPENVSGSEEYTGTYTIGNAEMPYAKDLNNCAVVCVLLDANTGEVVNAAKAQVGGDSGVESVEQDNFGIEISSLDDAVIVNTNGSAIVNIYTADGSLVKSASILGNATIPTGRSGIVIVTVNDGNNVTAKKVVLK